jgi:hypothetical protein
MLRRFSDNSPGATVIVRAERRVEVADFELR